MTFSGLAQPIQRGQKVLLKGAVREMQSRDPISAVHVSTDDGAYTITDDNGEFEIEAGIGDVLTFESRDIQTVRHTVLNDEDILVLVKDYEPSTSRYKKSTSSSRQQHRIYLDSASFYQKKDIKKSIDFVAKSIEGLGKRGYKKELGESLTLLGEIYQYYGQYDLAIANYKDALEARKSTKTALLLGKVYVLNKEYEEAEKTLEPLTQIKALVPFQKIELYETLGDAYKGLGDTEKAVAYYEQGLLVANKNQVSPKLPDLNSKIADAYARDNRLQEAEAFYGSSLNQAGRQAPQRAVQEKEKVADFYNRTNQYQNEIELRKESLDELKSIAAPVAKTEGDVISRDTITPQRINYKIANAYIAQDKYDEAIPYLEESIREADNEDDLIVQKDATRKLSEVYRQKGDFTKSLETYQKYVAVVDTLYIRKEQEISRAARFNREIASQQSRITGLEQERELSQSKYDLALTEQQLIQESNKRQRWVIYSLIFGMALTALAAFFYYRSDRQRKLTNNLLALKSLRSQMNPHFIFNALNSVNNYIAKNDERSANRYLSEFSTLMRAVLENSEEDFIPLSKELELLRLYLRLEHSRFPDKFDYQLNIDETLDIDSYEIPPMLLQPYLENAIWHGLRYKEEKGLLSVDLQKKNQDFLEITITDNGIGRKRSAALKTQNQKKQKSKGMGNIKKRIAILNEMYKDKVAVVIRDLNGDSTGTRVILTLKKD
ncbi:tetratricopeptide repeat protein [Flavobacteriaceae bacterium R33]|uniref:Tetratricopeptide repeat protein n=2 Tax=Poritiphilus flavus TaxID=2697053 RepID=A0A6L9EHX0_9FLAO|nr:tetratricopeptide repeat protein [Poritiphilus flavus]